MRKYLNSFIHNVIVHPLMMFVPQKYATLLHDRHADFAFGKDTRLDEIGLELGTTVFVVEASRGYDEDLQLLGIWQSLPDAIDNCKENRDDNKWSLDHYVVSEQKLNSNGKGKIVFSKSFNWETDKWDEKFLNQS